MSNVSEGAVGRMEALLMDEESRLREYVDAYEFRGEADYAPTDRERTLIEDALRGWVAQEDGLKRSALERLQTAFGALREIAKGHANPYTGDDRYVRLAQAAIGE